MLVLKTEAHTYVGGAMSATGYGTTTNKNMAICFFTVEEAEDWMRRHGRTARLVDFETGAEAHKA